MARTGRNQSRYYLFQLVRHIPWLKGVLRRKIREIEVYLPMDQYGLEVFTAGQLLMDMGSFFFGFLLYGVLSWNGSGSILRMFETLIIGILVAVFISKNRFDNWKVRQEKRLLEQMFEYVDNLRHAYYRTRDVEEAVYEAWGQAGEEWKLHLAVLEEYLFTEGVPELYERNRPNPFYISFLSICQCAIRYGEEEEHTVFLDNLEELQKNIQLELLAKEKEREIFLSVFEGMLLPLFALTWIERWSVEQIPELNTFYQNSTGGMVRIMICVVVWLCLQGFRQMKMGSRKSIRHSVIRPTQRMERLLWFWNRLEGKMGKWTAEIHQELNPEGGLIYFYQDRLLAAFITGLIGLFWFVGYEVSIWWLPLWILLALASSFLPYLKMVLNIGFYQNAREEEVAQFRSVLYMLSSVPQMNAEMILEWLEQFAWYYKGRITQWIDQRMYGDQEEQEERDPAGFYRILEDIQASDQVGIQEAFRDIVTKREFWMSRKRQQQELAQKKKEIYVQAVLLIPFGVAITAYLIVPFLYEGMKSLLSFTEMGV